MISNHDGSTRINNQENGWIPANAKPSRMATAIAATSHKMRRCVASCRNHTANPDKVMEMLKTIAMDVRTADEFRDLFVADPQVLGVDAVKGSELIFPVVFKTRPTKQYGPVREFKRRVRFALEENNLLPGDPYRVYSGANDGKTPTARSGDPSRPDPTTIKPQESNPFTSS